MLRLQTSEVNGTNHNAITCADCSSITIRQQPRPKSFKNQKCLQRPHLAEHPRTDHLDVAREWEEWYIERWKKVLFSWEKTLSWWCYNWRGATLVWGAYSGASWSAVGVKCPLTMSRWYIEHPSWLRAFICVVMTEFLWSKILHQL